jgi:hypothetical protein
MKRRRIGEWRYSPIILDLIVDRNGQLHSPGALFSGKEPLVAPDGNRTPVARFVALRCAY